MIARAPHYPSLADGRRELWLEVAGARLFALDTAGDGSPVVFLHGGLADHRAALLRMGGLAETHRLVTPDLRGSGRSTHRGELSWDRLADDVAAWLDCLGYPRAFVGGTSMGSGVALRFALRHPHRLHGLILMSPLYPGADRPMPEAATQAMLSMERASQLVFTQGVDALRPLFSALSEPVRQLAMEMIAGFDPGSVAATTRFLAQGGQPLESASELAALDTPVLLLPGVDAQHPAEIAAIYAQHLRRALIIEQTAPDVLEQLRLFCGVTPLAGQQL